MNREKVYNYFKSNFELKPSTNGWFRFGDAMAVNFIYLKVKDFKGTFRGSCIDYVMQLESIDFKTAMELVDEYDEVEVLIPEKAVRSSIELPEYFEYLHRSERAMNYIRGRGLSVEKCSMMGFGYCYDGKYIGYLIIPFYVKGVLVYWIARDIIGNPIRYMNPNVEKSATFFNEDALDLYDDVYLLEGWSDAMTIGDNAIACLGSSLTEGQLSRIIYSNIKSITLIPDKGFYRKWLHEAAKLSNHIDTYVISLESFTDGKDVNEIGRDNVLSIEAKKYSLKLWQENQQSI